MTGPLTTARVGDTITLLADGPGAGRGRPGNFLSHSPSSAEAYDVGLGFNSSWRPQITSGTPPLILGNGVTLTGSRFRGISEGSGGNSAQDSPGDYPLMQLRGIESGQTLFLLPTSWSTNSYSSAPVTGFPCGLALVTAFVNGIPGTGAVLQVSGPVPTAPWLTGVRNRTNGSFQINFTGTIGALFTTLVTTNLSLPLNNWTKLGGVTEISPGEFQFIDLQATNNPRRFYRIRSP